MHSNSKLVDYIHLSKKYSKRTEPITKIVIHHMAGRMTAKQCADYFVRTDRLVSANYFIGWDGSIAMGVEEKNRAWTSSSAWVDQRAITIEVSNEDNLGGEWKITNKSYQTLLNLVTDICLRNNIKNCSYTGTKSGCLQKHEWYAATNCPGAYLGSKFPEISKIVNERLKNAKTGKTEIDNNDMKFRLDKTTGVYRTAADAKNGKNKVSNYYSGNYYVYKIYDGMLNISKTPNQAGAWINPKEDRNKTTKTLAEIAKDVINGKFGNYPERKKNLENLGYDYQIVQAEVDRIMRNNNSIKVGDLVRVKKGARDYNGRSIASFVYSGRYRVDELKGSRAVLDKKGIHTAFNVRDLERI